MSYSPSVYAGPFAMWPGGHTPEQSPGGDVMFPDVFGWSFAATGIPGEKLTRDAPRAVYFYPSPYAPPRPGAPTRWIHFTGTPPGDDVGFDFLAVDQRAEVEAFRAAYAHELAEMAKVAGMEPVLGWGVIYGVG